MKFSIILATLNRSDLVKQSVKSILNQTYDNYEVIIIDQSTNDDTRDVISHLNKNNKIFYYKIDSKGLSIARNFGIKKSSGDYICLMDDDAEYREDFLNTAYKILNNNNYAVLSGLIIEKKSNKVFMPLMDKEENKLVTFKNINICSSASLVINRNIMIESVGLFDEKLGAGAYFGAGEEIDVLIRFLNLNYLIFYTKKLVVYHPYPIKKFDEQSCKRAYIYGLGEGALCKKVIKNSRNKYIFIMKLLKNIIKTSIAIVLFYNNLNKQKFYINRLKGLIKGYKKYN